MRPKMLKIVLFLGIKLFEKMKTYTMTFEFQFI